MARYMVGLASRASQGKPLTGQKAVKGTNSVGLMFSDTMSVSAGVRFEYAVLKIFAG